MPKNRKRVAQKGAKSESIHTTGKIGGRKSGKAVAMLNSMEIDNIMAKVRKRDKNKLRNELIKRGLMA